MALDSTLSRWALESVNFYFGLVGTNSTDDEVIVPYMNMEREAFLEYDLTKVLWQLTDISTPVTAVLKWTPSFWWPRPRGMGQPPIPPWMVIDQATQTMDVRNLPQQVDTISDDVDVLLSYTPRISRIRRCTPSISTCSMAVTC